MGTKIDLEELERLHSEAAGTPYKAKDDWIYAQSVSHKRTFSRRPMAYTIDNRDGRYKPTETAAYIVAACNAVPELVARVRELERQRDFLLMRGKTPVCLLCNDCSYLVGEPCNWGCTAGLETRKKCLEKAVERGAEGATEKTADVDAEQAAKEAGEGAEIVG